VAGEATEKAKIELSLTTQTEINPFIKHTNSMVMRSQLEALVAPFISARSTDTRRLFPMLVSNLMKSMRLFLLVVSSA